MHFCHVYVKIFHSRESVISVSVGSTFDNLFCIFIFSPNVKCPDPPITLADPDRVKDAIDVIQYAEKPLVIVGKGEK